jgi:hypothetical protein
VIATLGLPADCRSVAQKSGTAPVRTAVAFPARGAGKSSRRRPGRSRGRQRFASSLNSNLKQYLRFEKENQTTMSGISVLPQKKFRSITVV